MIAHTIVDCTKAARADETVEGCSESSVTTRSGGYIDEPNHSRDVKGHRASVGLSRSVRRGVGEGISTFEACRRVVAERAVRVDVYVAALSAGCWTRGSQAGVVSRIRINIVDQKSVCGVWLDTHVAQNRVGVVASNR